VLFEVKATESVLGAYLRKCDFCRDGGTKNPTGEIGFYVLPRMEAGTTKTIDG
jgi:hypothetical protein